MLVPHPNARGHDVPYGAADDGGQKWCFDFDPGQFHVIGVLIIYMNGLNYLGGI
jgi:hypothetical protein